MKNFLGVVFISLITLFFSCQKKEPNKTVDADIKAAFSYKPGTYWIYKDANSGQIDSFYVYVLLNYNFSSSNPAYTYDQVTTRMTGYNINNPTDTVTLRIDLQQIF